MYSLFFIAKNNIKKHKGEVAILFALIFLAALLLFSSLSLLLSENEIINECDRKYHVSDLIVFTSKTDLDGLDEIIKNVDNTAEYEVIPMIASAADYYYGDIEAEDATSFTFYFCDSTYYPHLNSFPEEFKDLKDDEIVLPYFQSNQVKVGDIVHIKTAGKEYDFKVKGYAENLYFATTLNISGTYALLSHDVFEEISANIDPESKMAAGQIMVAEGTDINEYDLALKKAFPEEMTKMTVTRDVINMSTAAMSEMASTIVMMFTLLLIGMSVIIMHFSIKNFIELNIQNIGLLQATGYTAKELRMACITEQMLISLAATALAVIAGIFISRPLSNLSGMLMGLTGFEGVCIPALITTVIAVPLMVLLGSVIATRSYRKLTVLESLRSGITSHNFKKNHFPLEKSRLPLSLALAGKNNFGSLKKSIFVILIVAFLTSSTCMGFSLFQNWALDNTALLKIVGVEFSDIMVGAIGDEDFIEDMESNSNVKFVNTWTTLQSMEVTYLDHSTNLGIDVYRDVSALTMNSLLEGHYPSNGNEIILSTIESENLHATVGDIINVKSMADSSYVTFTVCGIDQKINNMGKKAIVNEEGAKRINPDFIFYNALVYLNEPDKAKELKDKWQEEHPDYQFILGDDLFGSSIDMFSKAMEGICAIFVATTCFVVILTQLLLTRAQVIRERTDLGVSKALGYTSGELIGRTLMTNIPTIVIGILLGILMHYTLMSQLVLYTVSAVGIKQNDFSTDPIWLVITAAIILICAVVTALISSRGITKLEPVKILKEE